jgi:hypothetical protein
VPQAVVVSISRASAADPRLDIRTQLRIAYEMFDAMGMQAFAGRTRRELAAAGETARRRTAIAAGPQLTTQEE